MVRETTLDVDSWISKVLPLVLRDEEYSYQCLCDYKLKVIEVSQRRAVTTVTASLLIQMDEQSKITFIVVAVVQVASTTTLAVLSMQFGTRFADS